MFFPAIFDVKVNLLEMTTGTMFPHHIQLVEENIIKGTLMPLFQMYTPVSFYIASKCSKL